MTTKTAINGVDSGGQGWSTAIMQSQTHSLGEPPETGNGFAPCPAWVGEPKKRPVATTNIGLRLTAPGADGLIARFWEKVERRGPDDCWPWLGSKTGFGHGRIKIASYCQVSASRFSLVLHSGQDDLTLCSRHTCDNPSCVNPRHLIWGTIADNNNDKLVRGRARNGNLCGFSNPRVKLTPDNLRWIIDRFRAGNSNRFIASRLPIGESMVSRIRVGLSFKQEAEALGWFGKRPRAFPPALATTQRSA